MVPPQRHLYGATEARLMAIENDKKRMEEQLRQIHDDVHELKLVQGRVAVKSLIAKAAFTLTIVGALSRGLYVLAVVPINESLTSLVSRMEMAQAERRSLDTDQKKSDAKVALLEQRTTLIEQYTKESLTRIEQRLKEIQASMDARSK